MRIERKWLLWIAIKKYEKLFFFHRTITKFSFAAKFRSSKDFLLVCLNDVKRWTLISFLLENNLNWACEWILNMIDDLILRLKVCTHNIFLSLLYLFFNTLRFFPTSVWKYVNDSPLCHWILYCQTFCIHKALRSILSLKPWKSFS